MLRSRIAVLLGCAVLVWLPGCGGEGDSGKVADAGKGHPADVLVPHPPADDPLDPDRDDTDPKPDPGDDGKGPDGDPPSDPDGGFPFGPAVEPDEEPIPPGSGRAIVATPRAELPTNYRSDYVEWSPDGRYILDGGDGCRLVSVATGEVVRRFGQPRVAKFLPGGRKVITATDRGLAIWDIASGAVERTIQGIERAEVIHLSDDGSIAYAGSQFFRGGVVDVARGTFTKLDDDALGSDLRTVAISPDGSTLALSGKEGKVILVEAATGRSTKTWQAHEGDDVDGLVFLSNTVLVSSGETEKFSGKSIRTWNLENGEMTNEFVKDDSLGLELHVSPGRTRIAARGRSVYVDDPHGSGNSPNFCERSGMAISGVAFSPDGNRIAVVTNADDFLYLFDLSVTRESGSYEFARDWRGDRVLPAGDDKAIVLADYRKPRLVTLSTGETVHEFGDENLEEVSLSPDGETLVTVDDGLKWYTVADGSMVRETEGGFSKAAFSADGSTLFAVGREYDDESGEFVSFVREFDAKTGEPGRDLAGLTGSATAIAAGSGGKWLAVGTEDAHVTLFDRADGKLVRRHLVHEGEVSFLRFSPDGQWLVSGASEHDPYAALWRMGEPEPTLLSEHEGTVRGATFSPDDKRLVTADVDGTLRVRTLGEEEASFDLAAHDENLVSIEPLADGSGFLTLAGKQAKVWRFADLTPARTVADDDVIRSDVAVRGERRHTTDTAYITGWHGSGSSGQGLAVAGDESIAATFDFKGTCVVWDLKTIRTQLDTDPAILRPTLTDTDPHAARFILASFGVGAEGDVQGLALSRDGSKLLTVEANDEGGKVAIWNPRTGEKLKEFDGPKEYVDVNGSPNSDIVAVEGGEDEFVRLYNLATMEELPNLPFEERLEAAVIDRQGEHLIVVAETKLQLFELAGRKKVWETKLGLPSIDAISRSADGERIVILDTGFTGSELKTFRFSDGQPLVTCESTRASAEGADFTPDGRHVVMRAAWRASWGQPMFYDSTTGKLDRTLPNVLGDLHFAADGRTMIGASSDWNNNLGFYSLPDLFDDDLQAWHERFERVILGTHRDGPYLIVTVHPQGRISRELLAGIRDLGRPVKLDLLTLTDDDAKVLENAPNVHGVSVGFVDEDQFTAAGLKSLATLPNLHELVLGDANEEMFAALEGFPNLRVLKVDTGSDVEPAAFGVLAKLPKLEWVHLGLDGEDWPVAAEALAAAPISTLDLWLGDATPESLAELKRFPKLRVLGLRRVEELDERVAALADLPELRELVIDAQFTDAGLAHLVPLKLEYLDLLETQVESTAALVDAKSLKWLQVDDPDAEGHAAMRENRPEVRLFDR